MKRAIDLSHPLDPSTPPFPGTPGVEITIQASTAGPEVLPGVKVNSSRIAINLHTATHMDAPFHFIHEGVRIDRVALETCSGPAALVRFARGTAPRSIEVEHLVPHRDAIRRARRVVFDTDWSCRWKAPDYFTGHAAISPAAARWLVEQGVILIGVDFPSVDFPPHATHLVILGAGLVIVENLTNVDQLPESGFDFCALPLRIAGRDGSPVRAVAFVEAEPPTRSAKK